MVANSNNEAKSGPCITLDIPVQDGSIFRSETINDLLIFLSRHPDEAFSITDLADAVEYSRPSVTKSVDVLSRNDLVIENREGQRRLVQINRERLSLPDNPYLQIPQGKFHEPVKAATEAVVDELDGVIAVVLYGSVARGEADRRSDIDLWVLVEEDRMANQRRANKIRQDLEEETFDGHRYSYEIDVEVLRAVPNYANELQEILREGISLYESEDFSIVKNLVLHGDSDE